jgi:hypothetical protein
VFVHPADSTDAAPSDFFLFGPLEREMTGFTVNSQENILSEIHRIFAEIPKRNPRGYLQRGDHKARVDNRT